MVNSGRHLEGWLDRPVAAVYRGQVACDGCAESVAELLRKSPLRYKVHYLGPDEDHDISLPLLSHLDLFAWPGGGDDENADYEKVSGYTKAIQAYVSGGGKYAGFCMGAFLAGGKGENQTFFGLLPKGTYVSGERFQPGAQVTDTKDTIILTDWTFHSGPKNGTTENNRWQYFQDGAQISLGPDTQGFLVMGRYTNTSDPSAVILPYGKGSIGLIGTHPEADESWYDDENLTNPQGIQFDIGFDFLQNLHDFADSSTGLIGSRQQQQVHL